MIHRIRYSRRPVPPVGELSAPRRAAGPDRTPAGIATYRRLYRDGTIRLVGRERRDGRLLWKLEGDVAFAFHSFHAKPVPIMAVVVLVDPRTYLPVVQRTVSLLPGHRRQVQAESRAARLPAPAERRGKRSPAEALRAASARACRD